MLTPKIIKSFNNILPNCPDKDIPEMLKRIKKRDIERNGLDPKVVIVRLAGAYIRHEHTRYDKIVESLGKERARMEVAQEVDSILKKWRTRKKNPMLAWEVYKNNFSGKVFSHEK